ncbi:MAG TPA: GDSL-type esterase/lipase family protein [bacterium]|nr:GDSL-type esterase/lipase family protein [bacterium]
MKHTGLVVALIAAALLVGGISHAAQVEGFLYHDANQNSQSAYLQEFAGKDVPLRDVLVTLYNGAGDEEILTDRYGAYSFTDLAPGAYFTAFDLPAYESTSGNRGRRTAEAIAEGHLNLVCLGDSIGVMMYPPELPYPERLGAHFEQLTDVTLHNIHVGGSTSWEWLPGDEKAYYENRLLPVLADADLVTITINGNDFAPYAAGMSPPYNVWEIIQNFLEHPEYALQSLPRTIQLLEAIRQENTDCDIVMILYPNFFNSTWMQDVVGDFLPLVVWFYEFYYSIERYQVADLDGILISDTLLAMDGFWMDDYLHDEVHPTEAGSQIYADEVFKTLGGVLLDEETSVAEQMIGFYAPDYYAGNNVVLQAK